MVAATTIDPMEETEAANGNEMLLEPAGTVNVPGTVSASLLDFRKAVTSADGAALRVRVHDPPAGWAAAENVHTSDVRVGVVTSDATREREAEAVAVPTV